jgi:hypothetical protein
MYPAESNQSVRGLAGILNQEDINVEDLFVLMKNRIFLQTRICLIPESGWRWKDGWPRFLL